MSDLRHVERIKIERLFQMGEGYVLDFSNRTLTDFVFESVERNIYADNYSKMGESKANRLRCFWNEEPNYVVAKLLSALLVYFEAVIIPASGWDGEKEDLYKSVVQSVERLKSDIGEHINTIQANSDEKDFVKLSKVIRELIEANKPDEAIDRLHTFLIKFLQNYCNKHNITSDTSKPLHSLLGEYLKAIKAKGFLQSEMSERILKYAISILESYNSVRNNQSFAHANSLLNHEESLLIFRMVSSLIDFINALEKINTIKPKEPLQIEPEFDLPF